MKVVINDDYGGFSLSEKAQKAYFQRKGWTWDGGHDTKVYDPGTSSYQYGKCHIVPEIGDEWFDIDVSRTDPDLIAVVQELGEEANGYCATLKIVDIPHDVEWIIHEHDGLEHIAEKHRTW